MYIPNPSVNDLLLAAKEQNTTVEEVVVFLVAEKTELNYEELIAGLNAANIRFFGAIFPGIIYDKGNYESGVLLQKHKVSYLLELDLDDGLVLDPHLKADLKSTEDKQTAMLFLDGLSPSISRFLFALNNELANTVNFIGGGAGSLSLQQAPCIFTTTGLHQDKAIIAILPQKMGLGIQHGWEAIHGPLVATKTEKNVIHELNWRNAYQVYKELVDADSGQTLEVPSFFDLAKGYPFGMSVEGEEDIVRDPIIATPEGSLVCVGEIRNNTVLNLLRGKAENLIKAAEMAVIQAIETLDAEEASSFFVIDCISRVLFLGDDFEKELEAFNRQIPKNLPAMHGALTLGEISSTGMKQLRFYNKTIVIAALA